MTTARPRLAPPAERRAALEARFSPWQPVALAAVLDRAADEYPDRALFVTDEHEHTYAEVRDRSRRIAAGLVALGVQAGDHVAMIMANYPEFAAVKFAIARIGATCVPMNFLFRAQEIGYVLRQSDATVLITMDRYRDLDYRQALDTLVPGWEQDGGGEHIPGLRHVVVFSPAAEAHPGETTLAAVEDAATPGTLAEVAARETRVDPQAYCDILYTSGTTGSPKGVLLRHDQIVRESYAGAYQRALEDGRRMGFPLPMYHVFGYLECLVPALFVGGAVVPQVVFDAAHLLAQVERHRVNEVVAVPAVTLPVLAELARGSYDVSSVHTVFSSGGIAPATIWDDIRAAFGDVELVTGYGMTETTATTTCTNPEDDETLLRTTNGHLRHGGAAGDPELDGLVAVYKTVDPETEADLPPGTFGHLLARGLVVTDGYYRKPDETALAFTADGWLRTGDLGTVDADGNLTLSGRLKESFRTGGEMVMPREIELVLGGFPGVAQVHVAGVAHDRMGEVATAWVVATDPADPPDAADLVAHAEANLARFKVPRHVFVVEAHELPVTVTGRVQKFRLTEMAQQRLAGRPRP